MEHKETIKRTIDNAIRSMYQMILAVNEQTQECHVIDYNREIQNISDDVSTFGDFCNKLFCNIHPEDRETFNAFIDMDFFPNELNEKVYTSIECRIRHTNHRYYWSEIIFCNAAQEDSAEGHDYLFLIQDIHAWKEKEVQEEAEQRALLKELQDKYDKLFEENMKDAQTGCYNRKGMKYYTDIVLDEARKTGKHLFVCVADLNGLKHLNDTYGHAAGDEAIATVSKELLKAAPSGCKIVRTGGDEFLLFTTLHPGDIELQQMSEKLDAGLKAYNDAHDNPFTIGASYGWVLLPIKENMINLDEYIEMADAKMYEMKVERDQYRRE